MRRHSSLVLALAATLVAASPAAAQTRTWNLGDQTAPGSCAFSGGSTVGSSPGIGNQYNCSQQPSGTTTSLVIRAFNVGTTAGSTVAEAAVDGPWGSSGIGVGTVAEGGTNASSTSGTHSMDNNNGGGSDFLLLDFLAPNAQVRSVSFGWTESDSDWQLLRWTGSNGPTLVGRTVAQMFGDGWSLVGAFNGQGARSYTVNPGGLASRYWIVASFNPQFGTTNGFTTDATADRIKVSGITASTVPEPSTYALLGSGLLALGGLARRRARQRQG